MFKTKPLCSFFLSCVIVIAQSCSDSIIDLTKSCAETFIQSGIRNAHGLVYEQHNQTLLLFGGADAFQVCGDTWSWDGSRWTLVTDSGPSPRTFPAMTYDPQSRRTYLFGGNSVLFGDTGFFNFDPQTTLLGDFWIRENNSWMQIEFEDTGPQARAESAIAYDTDANRLVLFGGYTQRDGSTRRLGDTWVWNGSSWELITETGPPAQNGAVMTYDSEEKRIILFGQSRDQEQSETWILDGSEWSLLTDANSPRRYNSALAYDSGSNRTIRFGGWTGDDRTNDTWILEGENWTELNTSGPSKRNHSAMVYDSLRNRLLLYGGHDGNLVYGDLWAFSGNSWSLLQSQEATARIRNNH